MPAYLRSRLLRRGGVFRDLTHLFDLPLAQDLELLQILPDRIGHLFEGRGLRRTIVVRPRAVAPQPRPVIQPGTFAQAYQNDFPGLVLKILDLALFDAEEVDAAGIPDWQVVLGENTMPMDENWFIDHTRDGDELTATIEFFANVLWDRSTLLSYLRMCSGSLYSAREILVRHPELTMRVLYGLDDPSNLRVARRYFDGEEGAAQPRWPFTRPLS